MCIINKVPFFVCLGGVYPHSVTLNFHLSCFEILKHTRKINVVCCCFELGFLQFVGEFKQNCVHVSMCGIDFVNNIGC